MTIALASRGYLCPVSQVIVQVGPGPDIIDQQVLSPDIDGSFAIEAEGPSISGSVEPAPEVSGSSGEVDTGIDPPSLTGSDEPKIS